MAEEQRVRGACPMDCPDTCSWIVTIKDGRAVKLEGDRAHPFTRGALCNFRPISPASLSCHSPKCHPIPKRLAWVSCNLARQRGVN
jgi:Molybdopterin oxidoreductase Fe4S4 domain